MFLGVCLIEMLFLLNFIPVLIVFEVYFVLCYVYVFIVAYTLHFSMMMMMMMIPLVYLLFLVWAQHM